MIRTMFDEVTKRIFLIYLYFKFVRLVTMENFEYFKEKINKLFLSSLLKICSTGSIRKQF